jgi:NAD(P)-dependent dehydrogenase (short-subunit alcohol dehydrogenase family)
MTRLNGKTAVITGGATGIGRAAAKRFIEEGAFVFIFGRRQEALDAAVAELGPNARAVKGSVSDEADLDRLYAAVKAERGTLDIVFANAGVGSQLRLGEITAKHIDETFDVNVKGTIFTVQKALPLMGKGGSIILTGSSAGTTGAPAFTVYSASKAAVRNLARTWAEDLKGTGIRVNVLSPGATATDLAKEALGEEGLKAYGSMTALQRMGDPAEVGAAAAFLASSDSSFMTGQRGRGRRRPRANLTRLENTQRKRRIMKTLEGKVAVITGGSSGIGLATAKRFVDEGAHVVITGRREKELKEAAAFIKRNVTTVVGDVSRLEDLDRLYAVVKEKHGHIDILFANAGAGTIGPLAVATEAHFDQTFDVNVKGLFFTVQKALPLFKDGGSIILNSSVSNVLGVPGFSAYAASKAAVRNFSRAWTLELKDRKIRVNTMSPGPIETPALETTTGLTPEQAEQAAAQFASQIPMGRRGKPEEIAAAVTFLASDESSFITGVDLPVDGGMAQV